MNCIRLVAALVVAFIGFSVSAETAYPLSETPSAAFVGSVAKTVQARLRSDDAVDVCEHLLVLTQGYKKVAFTQEMGCTPSGDGALLHGYAVDHLGVGAYLVYVTRGNVMALPSGQGAFAEIPGADSDEMAVRRIRLRLEHEIDAGSASITLHSARMLGDTSLRAAYASRATK